MNAGLKGSAVLQHPEQLPAKSPVRFVSAASLFDGHDAAINMIRRLLQAHGAEVVHLGHNRSVADIVRAAIQEDADGIAVSSLTLRGSDFKFSVDPIHGSYEGKLSAECLHRGYLDARSVAAARLAARNQRDGMAARLVTAHHIVYNRGQQRKAGGA